MKNRIISTILMICFVCAVFIGCSSDPCRKGHDWQVATCNAPQVCKVCGTVTGEALGHKWEKATCTTPRTCSRCGEIEGQSLSETKQHVWEPASCTSPKTCSVCGETEGKSLGHSYNDSGICKVCNATKEYGNAYGYFSKSEIYAMAKHALEEYVYPSYVSNYLSIDKIVLQEADAKLYGNSSYAIVTSVDIVINAQTYKDKKVAIVVEPHTSTTYQSKDIYLY